MPPGKGVPRGFPNLARIRESIGLLVPKIKKGLLPPPKPPWQGWERYDSSDHIISAQRLAVDAAKVYQLNVGTLVITFASSLSSAAQVEIGPTNDFFIEVESDFIERPRDLGAVLGHELAHIFLHRHNIRIPDTWGNEILTDTTAAMYGFGALMADTFTVTETSHSVANGTQITRQERSLGYLTPDEIGYVLTRCSPANVAAYLRSSAAKSALRVGRRKALLEIRTPPLQLASLSSRMVYRMKRMASIPTLLVGLPLSHRYGFGDDKVSFRCPQCCQAMRLPTKKTIKASCPRCESQLHCRT